MAEISIYESKSKKRKDFVILPIKEYNKLILDIHQNKLRRAKNLVSRNRHS